MRRVSRKLHKSKSVLMGACLTVIILLCLLIMVLADSSPLATAATPSVTYSYTGNVQTYTVPTSGVYKLEIWGGEGAMDYASASAPRLYGGKGGYSVGETYLECNTVLYLYVADGYHGTHPSSANSLFGAGNGYGSGGSGGGASHIALCSGTLSSFGTPTHAASQGVLLVAGGGGGSGDYGSGGNGGGTTGGKGKGGSTINGTATADTGAGNTAPVATQTSGYAFGKGEDSITGVNYPVQFGSAEMGGASPCSGSKLFTKLLSHVGLRKVNRSFMEATCLTLSILRDGGLPGFERFSSLP